MIKQCAKRRRQASDVTRQLPIISGERPASPDALITEDDLPAIPDLGALEVLDLERGEAA